MKFLNLLKKELRELINAQMIAGMVIVVALLLAMGSIMTKVMNDAAAEGGSVNICDLDKTDFTADMVSHMEEIGFEVTIYDKYDTDKAALLDELECDSLIVIPDGFTQAVSENTVPGSIEVINRMRSASAVESMRDASSSAVLVIEDYIKRQMMNGKGLSDEEIENMNSPLQVSEATVVSDKWESVSSGVLMSMLNTQSAMVPIVVLILVMLTSQMIISAISTEKIDKTLETLLSVPVSRVSVLSAKMIAAALVALLNAAVYMIGFYGYMGSVMKSSINADSIGQALSIDQILSELGLKLGVGGYALVGIQMFLTIMICLAVSLILGALVNDAKSAQTVLTPIMVLAMIPYLVSMLYDVNLLSGPVKLLINAIPFTHTFSAINNIMFGRMDAFWLGLLYQVVLFLICMFFAVRLFMSDKIFTTSLNLTQKAKLKKQIKK